MGGCVDGRCGCGWLNNYMQSICPCNSWFGLEGGGLEGGGLEGAGLEGAGLEGAGMEGVDLEGVWPRGGLA